MCEVSSCVVAPFTGHDVFHAVEDIKVNCGQGGNSVLNLDSLSGKGHRNVKFPTAFYYCGGQ